MCYMVFPSKTWFDHSNFTRWREIMRLFMYFFLYFLILGFNVCLCLKIFCLYLCTPLAELTDTKVEHEQGMTSATPIPFEVFKQSSMSSSPSASFDKGTSQSRYLQAHHTFRATGLQLWIPKFYKGAFAHVPFNLPIVITTPVLIYCVIFTSIYLVMWKFTLILKPKNRFSFLLKLCSSNLSFAWFM